MNPFKAHNRPQWIAALMLAGALLLLAIVPGPRQDNTLPLPARLPERIGNYQGVDWQYCQAAQCYASYRSDSLAQGTTNCPACQGALDAVSYAEKTLLPRGTVVVKKGYEAPGEPGIFVSLVISGDERRGIHKPQVCLKGQGHTIQAQYTVDVPLAEGDVLPVTVLDLVAGRSGDAESSAGLAYNAYAYWFESTHHKTPYHLARLGMMAYESVIEGVRRRWAYVAIATARDPASDEYEQRLKFFIAELASYLEDHRPSPLSAESQAQP